MNNQAISAINKQSENDGFRARAMPRPTVRAKSPARGAPAGGSDSDPSDGMRDWGGECVEVAKGGGPIEGTPGPSKVIDLPAHLL